VIAEEGVRLLAAFGPGDLRLFGGTATDPASAFVRDGGDPGFEGCGTANLNCTAGSGGWSLFAG
jgi:hypothetical protein